MNVTVNRTPQVPPPVESVTLELTLEEFFLLSALQYGYLGGSHPARDTLQLGFRQAFTEAFPDVGRISGCTADIIMQRFPEVA